VSALRRGVRRARPGDVLLALAATAAWTAAVLLVVLPVELATGPALRTLYAIPELLGLPGRTTWAVLWAAVAAAPTAAVLRPTRFLRARAFEVLLGSGLCWTLGQSWPLLEGLLHILTNQPGPPQPANFWAPLVWGFALAAGATVWLLVPLDDPRFYRRRRPAART